MATDEALHEAMRAYRAAVDEALVREAASWRGPARLIDAMRYALESGGKRIRPCMAMAAAAACGADPRVALEAGVAIELLHTYSLVHDDLPAMDDDDFRRGVPTVHRRFDEATAILAGDALLTRALAAALSPSLPPERGVRIAAEVARAGGHEGMVGGQILDIAGDLHGAEALREMHAGKTGALFVASCRTGAIAAGASADLEAALVAYGEAVGEAFQLSDDLIDEIEQRASSQDRDAHEDRVNVAAVLGPSAALERVEELAAEALACVAGCPGDGAALETLAAWVRDRARAAAAALA
jgi:geranylgeranyl pyrophosphate synthase